MANTPRQWTIDEDALLKAAVAEYGDEPGMWKSIALRVPGRTNKACRKRWLHSLSPTVKKTPWTPEEDALLLKLYATHNPPRWSLIAKCIPGRTDDACSKRYREALDPQLKRDQWTTEEDAKLLELTTHLGSKWTQVGHAMGRSGLGCRNRWRLLERKQHPRNVPRSSVTEQSHPAFFGPASPYMPAHDPHVIPSCLPVHFQNPASSSAHPGNTSFPDETTAHGLSGTSVDPPGQLMATGLILIHGPPPSSISTSSSLSGALASTAIEAHPIPAPDASLDPELVPTFQHSPPNSAQEIADDVIPMDDTGENFEPSGSSSPERGQSPTVIPDDVPTDTPQGPQKQGRPILEDSLPKPPRKRPRIRGPVSTESDVTTSPRLSSHLPATTDRSILPYACGHPSCWPGLSGNGASRYATAAEVAEHRRLTHVEDSSAEEVGKPFRCALQGCGKGWKNINGIQYHLQISKAHFRTALLSQTRTDGDAVPETEIEAPKKHDGHKGKRKEYHCPHDGCTNVYKQRTGLQYHLAHGHPTDIAQLEIIPPTLMRKMAVEAPSGSASATPVAATTMTSTPHPEQDKQ